MKSFKNIGTLSIGYTLSSDDIIEFHAARIILLIYLCSIEDQETKLKKIDGLTKLAKLDFFIRYPEFFKQIASYLNNEVKNISETNESKMIRHHYGPWDKRYYQIIPYLKSKNIIEIKKGKKNNFEFNLTTQGESIAISLIELDDFKNLKNNIIEVNKVLGHLKGSKIKDLIYKVFEKEISDKKLGELIE
jgi:hypothetical protein